MGKKNMIASLLFILGMSVLIGSLSQDRNQLQMERGVQTPRSSATDAPIHIDGNSGWSDFKDAGNCTGQGTYSDPYIMQNLLLKIRLIRFLYLWVFLDEIHLAVQGVLLQVKVFCENTSTLKRQVNVSFRAALLLRRLFF